MGSPKNNSNQYLIPDYNVSPFYAIHEPQLGQEIDLIKQWFSMPIGQKLQTNTGNQIIIINHGQHNHNKGPDIKGANLFINGKFIKGDIECHVYERDWYTHGHDHDLNYKNVILHLIRKVMQKYSPINQTLVLTYVHQWGCSLNINNISKYRIASLEILSSMRWHEKVNACRKENAHEQLAKALGCGGNETSFLHLIHSINKLELISLSVFKQMKYIKRKAEHIEWEHCGVRPAQWPERRFNLLAELLSFIVTIENENISNHNVFNQGLKDKCPSGGKSILIECCINYFYPRFAAEALKENNHKIFINWKDAWHQLKLQKPYGKQTKNFGEYFSRKDLCSVKVTQGLLQLEKEYCNHHYCTLCPIKELNNNSVKN